MQTELCIVCKGKAFFECKKCIEPKYFCSEQCQTKLLIGASLKLDGDITTVIFDFDDTLVKGRLSREWRAIKQMDNREEMIQMIQSLFFDVVKGKNLQYEDWLTYINK